MMAIDMLTLLTEVAAPVHAAYPAMPARILQALCYSVSEFMTNTDLRKSPWVNKVLGLTCSSGGRVRWGSPSRYFTGFLSCTL